jgi:hypothetical protein
MREAREHIAAGTFKAYHDAFLARYQPPKKV